jgi:hypothetical protein
MPEEEVVVLKTKVLKTAKQYFDETLFRETLTKYKETLIIRDGKIASRNEELERSLVKQIEKIVNAIIIVYRYYLFEDYEDLKQHALNACFTNFLKFDPAKGTAFNYFSIISKISLLNLTQRKQKHRNHKDIDEEVGLEAKEPLNYDLFFDELENTLFGIVDENFVGTKRTRYVRIISVILDYLRKTKRFVGKSDLYAWGRSFGLKNNLIREFITDMSRYNSEIFEGLI